MFADDFLLFVHVYLYARLWICLSLCVCQFVHLSLYSRGRRTLDTHPNTLRGCLFNHNLGLHENANGKQAGFTGRLCKEKGRGKDEWRWICAEKMEGRK